MSVKMKALDSTSAASLQDAEDKVVQTADMAVTAMTDAVEKTVREFTQKGFARMPGGTAASLTSNVNEGLAKVMKTSEDMMSFGQGNLEAAMKTAQIFATGLQDISKQVAASTQASIEDSVATMKAIAGMKSVKEVIDLQTSFARGMVEKAIAESGKLTDASLKLTEQAIAPLTARVSLAVDKFSNAA
jgi:phasin family protein